MVGTRRLHQLGKGSGLTYPSVIRLGEYLGETTRLVDAVELSVQYFQRTAGDDAKAATAFVAEVKKTHKVSTCAGPVDTLLRQVPRSYVMQGHSVVSEFAHDFRVDFQRISRLDPGKWLTRDPNDRALSDLAQLKANLPSSGGLASTAALEFEVLEYYRACRNAYLHRLKMSSVEPQYHELLANHGSAIVSQFHRSPSGPSDVRYGDYVLLGRLLVSLASKINEACPLTPTHAADALLDDPVVTADLKTYRGNGERLRKKAAMRAVNLLWASDLAAREVGELVAKRIEGEPTNRERHRLRRRAESRHGGPQRGRLANK